MLSMRSHHLVKLLAGLVLAFSGSMVSSGQVWKPPVALASPPPESAAGSGAAPWDSFTSMPLGGGTTLSVNMRNGNLMVAGPALSVAEMNGFDLTVAPVYNSLSKGILRDMGNGWLMGTGQDVDLVIGSGSITYYDASGHSYVFGEPTSCSFTAPAGVDAKLACASPSGYTLTDNQSQVQLNFDSTGVFTSMQNSTGQKVTLNYSACGSNGIVLGSMYSSVAASEFVSFDSNAQCQTTVASHGGYQTFDYGYDASNDLTSITDKLGNATAFGYDANGNLDQVTDPNGNVTLITYTLGTGGAYQVTKIVRVTNKTTNTGPTWTFSYGSGSGTTISAPFGRCFLAPTANTTTISTTTGQVTDPNSHTTTDSFDSSNLPRIIAYPDGTNEELAWTSDNHIAGDKSPSGAVTAYSYDGNNNLTQVVVPTGACAQWVYAAPGHPYLPSTSTDMQGNNTNYAYNTQGLVTSVSEANGNSQSFSYNANGTMATAADENGNQTSYTYNSIGLPSQDTPPSSLGTTSYAFNGYNLESSVTDGKGQLTSFSYDSDGQLTGVGFVDGAGLGYSYDPNGNVTAMTDSTGTTTYSYNSLDELTQKTLPGGQIVSYTYDNAGNLSTKTDSGGTITYGYDSNDEVTSVQDRSGNTTSLGYDADGNNTSMGFPNGVSQSMSYNSAGQLTQISGKSSGGSTLTSYSYGYSNPATSRPTGLPYSVTDTSGNTTAYSYDTNNQLTQALQKTSGGSTLNNWQFGYDPAGNMTSKAVNGTSTTFTYNNANLPTQASGGMNMTYSYDKNGDLTSRSDGTSLSLNAAGQITSVTPPGSPAVAMSYTGVGETERTARGSTSYRYDATGLSQQTDTSGSTYFTALPDGGLISETVSGSTYYYLSDGAGSVAALTDTTGTLRNQYSYDPLGNATCTSCTVANPITFQGATFDSQTGFYYTGGGYYDPATGQAFGCHDKGHWDPGEDLCGEDGDPQCGGDCIAPGRMTSNAEIGNEEGGVPGPAVGGGAGGGGAAIGIGLKVLFQNAIKATVKASRAVAQAVEEFFAGERGSLKFNIGGRTIGFTRHGLNQVINRGVRPYEILDALRNPVRVLPGRGGVTRYIGRWAEIRVNGAGEVVTAIRFKSPEAP